MNARSVSVSVYRVSSSSRVSLTRIGDGISYFFSSLLITYSLATTVVSSTATSPTTLTRMLAPALTVQ